MSSIPLPAPLYRRPTLRIVAPEEERTTFVRPFRRRRRTIQTIREQVLCDPQFSRQHIL